MDWDSTIGRAVLFRLAMAQPWSVDDMPADPMYQAADRVPVNATLTLARTLGGLFDSINLPPYLTHRLCTRWCVAAVAIVKLCDKAHAVHHPQPWRLRPYKVNAAAPSATAGAGAVAGAGAAGTVGPSSQDPQADLNDFPDGREDLALEHWLPPLPGMRHHPITNPAAPRAGAAGRGSLLGAHDAGNDDSIRDCWLPLHPGPRLVPYAGAPLASTGPWSEDDETSDMPPGAAAIVDLLDQDAEYEPLFDDALEADDDDGLLDPMLR